MKLLYRTLSARTSRVTECLTKQPDPIRLLCFWTLAGVAAGTVLSTVFPAADEALWLSQGLAVTDRLRTLWDVYRTALIPALILLLGIWLCGSSACGQPAALALLFSRGAAVGLCAAQCFTEPSENGLFRAAVCVLPMGFLSALILIYAVRDALRLSGRLWTYLFRGQNDAEIVAQQHTATMHLLLYLLFLLIAAGIHTALLWLISQS